MIQINLIPDVKQEYLKARRQRNLAITFSMIAGLAAGATVALSILFLLFQVGMEGLADKGIKDEYAKLQQVEGLSELVTIQNQLSLVSGQHRSRSIDSRLFSVMGAINPPAPNDVRFTSVRLDPKTNLLTLEGVADGGYPAVEALKKTIANVSFAYQEQTSNGEFGTQKTVPIADQLEVGQTSYGEASDGKRVLRFTIVLKYSKVLFSNKAQKAHLVTPTDEIDVTDSRIQVPNSLFSSPAADEKKEK